MDRIKDIVQEELKIPSALIKSDRWTAKKTEFLIRIKKHLVKNPFEVPIDRTAFSELSTSKEGLAKTVEILIEENQELESLVDSLKRLKDKTEVAAVLKERSPSTQFQEFERLIGLVKKWLAKNSSIMNGIIFRSYTGKDLIISVCP